jgi:TFIIF-interacting CTD phosphatase-like protein
MIKKIFMSSAILSSGTFPIYMINEKMLSKNKLNIVFDIDNTIISSEKIKNFNQHNNKYITNHNYLTNLPNRNNLEQYLVWKRPYSELTLNILSKFTNIYFYTAATSEYAHDIIKGCYPNLTYKGIYHRDHWINHNKTKDLTIIDNSNNIILIDDKLYNNVANQQFYHITQFHYHSTNADFEMIKLFFHLIKKI